MKLDLKDTKQVIKLSQFNVCYVGNFDRNSVGEPEIAISLEELGYTVFRLQEFKTSLEEIKKTIIDNNCHLFLFAKLRVPKLSVDFLRSLPCPSVCWQFDLMFGIEE